jgi:hypothetical protein
MCTTQHDFSSIKQNFINLKVVARSDGSEIKRSSPPFLQSTSVFAGRVQCFGVRPGNDPIFVHSKQGSDPNMHEKTAVRHESEEVT